MPWVHCGHQIADDDHACPGCGVDKPTWTVRLDKTRVFALSGHPDEDHQAQATTLIEAADQGAPFCEQCEQAKAGATKQEPASSS